MKYIVPLIIYIMILVPRAYGQQQAVGILPLIHVGMHVSESINSQDNASDTLETVLIPEFGNDSVRKDSGKLDQDIPDTRSERMSFSKKRIASAFLRKPRPGRLDPVGAMMYFVVLKTINYEYRER